MKLVLCTVFIIFSLNVFTQTDTTQNHSTMEIIDRTKKRNQTKSMNTIGDELIKSANRRFIGNGLIIGGGIITSVGLTFENSAGRTTAICGGMVSVVGLVVLIDSNIHLRRAGLLCNQYGIGVKVTL